MRLLQQNNAAQPLVFLMIDSTNHITGKTGLAPVVTLSKNGGVFGAPAGVVTEIANGWYKVAGNATDTDTLGVLILHAAALGADPLDVEYDVEAIPAAVWAYIARTLTGGAYGASFLSTQQSNMIECYNYSTFDLTLTGVGIPVARTRLWFTAKIHRTDADSAAILQIEETDDLLYVQGGAPTAAANGLLTVDPVTGNVRVWVDAVEMAKLLSIGNGYYDLKVKEVGGTVRPLYEGTFVVRQIITRGYV